MERVNYNRLRWTYDYCGLRTKYYIGKCSSGLSELIPPPNTWVFARTTRLSKRSHAFTVATMSHRTTHYRENSFFNRTARLWKDLPANIFPEGFNISVFKARVNQHFLLNPPSILLLYLFFFKPMQCNAFIEGIPMRFGFALWPGRYFNTLLICV